MASPVAAAVLVSEEVSLLATVDSSWFGKAACAAMKYRRHVWPPFCRFVVQSSFSRPGAKGSAAIRARGSSWQGEPDGDTTEVNTTLVSLSDEGYADDGREIAC